MSLNSKKERVEQFLKELHELSERHQIQIDCHAEFMALLRDKDSGEVFGYLYDNCDFDSDIDELADLDWKENLDSVDDFEDEDGERHYPLKW